MASIPALRAASKPICASSNTTQRAGFALSNLLVAWCGAMTAEVNGYADLSMGFGMALTGIGTVVIGRQIFKSLNQKHHFLIYLELFQYLF